MLPEVPSITGTPSDDVAGIRELPLSGIGASLLGSSLGNTTASFT
jgi:hypothetical protein